MIKALFATCASAILLYVAGPAPGSFAPSFRKVSDHFYYLEPATGTANTGAVITGDGVLLIDPPPEPETPGLLNALKSVTSKPVRWVVYTDYQRFRAGDSAAFQKLGAVIIDSKEQDRLAGLLLVTDPSLGAQPAQTRPNPRFLFTRQLHLFPAGIEVRILAVRYKARTAGDVIIFVPSEKVLEVGDLFTPSSYPVIDSGPGEGSAPGWIEGLKQVIDSVPLLKSAMPQPKPDPSAVPEPEKTLEELVTVIPGHGAPANLQHMKDLLALTQKLRTEAARAVAAKRSRDDFLRLLSMEVFGAYSNLEAFAGQLFDDLFRK
jgi:glyoxylase-like metal-dependent hydrolase (beta-lactamase superfamily II)